MAEPEQAPLDEPTATQLRDQLRKMNEGNILGAVFSFLMALSTVVLSGLFLAGYFSQIALIDALNVSAIISLPKLADIGIFFAMLGAYGIPNMIVFAFGSAEMGSTGAKMSHDETIANSTSFGYDAERYMQSLHGILDRNDQLKPIKKLHITSGDELKALTLKYKTTYAQRHRHENRSLALGIAIQAIAITASVLIFTLAFSNPVTSPIMLGIFITASLYFTFAAGKAWAIHHQYHAACKAIDLLHTNFSKQFEPKSAEPISIPGNAATSTPGRDVATSLTKSHSIMPASTVGSINSDEHVRVAGQKLTTF